MLWGGGLPRATASAALLDLLVFPLGERALTQTQEGAVIIWDVRAGSSVCLQVCARRPLWLRVMASGDGRSFPPFFSFWKKQGRRRSRWRS